MVSAYKNNNDTLMTWDIFQHQEQRMLRTNVAQAERLDEYRTRGQAKVQSGNKTNAYR